LKTVLINESMHGFFLITYKMRETRADPLHS